jgi:hypothetical protein
MVAGASIIQSVQRAVIVSKQKEKALQSSGVSN